jgi:hypothetical protein
VSLTAAAFLTAILALLRIGGGFALLWWLGAPGWALAAWLLLHTRVRLDLSKLKGQG